MVRKLDESVLYALLDAAVDDHIIDLILAALEGESALDGVLSGHPPSPRPDPKAERVSPVGAFLSRLTVRGFRGIGAQAVVNLPPGPGLTVIAGRNGSGKSSLSEALECALTGTTNRWERELGHKEFRAGWRNLHHGDACEIALTLHQEGRGAATVRVTWPRDATSPDKAVRTYQVAGQPREATDLGWTAALQSFRPMLSYDDLGMLLTAKPTELHDSIAKALDLDALTSAVALLQARIAPLKAPLKKAGDIRKALRNDLLGVDDERARAAVPLLGRSSPDLVALQQLAAGSTTPTGPLHACQRILAVEVPGVDVVATAVRELDQARAELDGLGERRVRVAELRDRLLNEALAYHSAAGDGTCPVCETGTLDGDWRARTRSALEEHDFLRQARVDAEHRLQQAETTIRQLIARPPAVLDQSEVELATQPQVIEAWRGWVWSPQESSEQLLKRHRELAEAVAAWRAETKAYATTWTERWTPYAARLALLVAEFASAQEQDAQASTLDAAHAAASGVAQQLRTERLQPIVDRTKHIWEQLRQESNVSLKEIELTGRGTRRTVDIKAVVDDAAGSSALSVMSQGELNSLALALYLPRATSEESPFRFLVLDDPVQAMDPTKVDGLAAVLAELALTRQVIVFSHDDRFAQAARRLPIPPTVLSVRRDTHSRVIVQRDLHPAQRHLNDAYAILREQDMDDDVRRRVLPVILRAAIEAAAWERHCSSRLRAGDRLDDLELSWESAARTRARLELLLGSGTMSWLAKDARRGRALSRTNAGTHRPMTGNPAEAYDDAKALVVAIESLPA